MGTTPEGKVLSKVRQYCKDNGILTIRMALMRGVEAGWPDLMVIIDPGMVMFIELKAPGKKPTPLQARRAAELHKFGIPALWFDSAEEAIAEIKRAQAIMVEYKAQAAGVNQAVRHG